MRKQFFLVLLVAVFMASCGSTGNMEKFSDTTGKDWKLILVSIDGEPTGKEIIFNRKTLSDEKAGNIFIMKIDPNNISGTGAPNNYSAPYTLGEGQNISIMPIRSTLMASLWQPEKLKEQEFFVYMQNVYEWKIDKKNLELHSKTEDNRNVKLVFEL